MSTDRGHYKESISKPISVYPEKTATMFSRAIQYRRTNDVIYEPFNTPVINPEIEVIISDAFDHEIAFGTPGGFKKSRYRNHYRWRRGSGWN